MTLVGGILAIAVLALATSVIADEVPNFRVEPFWPKPLPNNWILGQVAGIATDRYDRIWIVQRPLTLTPRERAAEQNPPEAKCCAAAPPVLVFDTSGNLLRHWGGPGQGYQWPENEHGIFIDDTISSGSPATARRTASCSSSRWTASSYCRSASRATATTATRPTVSAHPPMWRSMFLERRSFGPAATPTGPLPCLIQKPAPTNGIG